MKKQNVLAKMFQENTGSHFLDSGGAYGRNWEHNAGKDFEKLPTAWLEVSHHPASQYSKEGLDFNLTVSSYHFCNSRLDFSKSWNDKFHRFAKRKEFEDSYWLEIIEAWFEHLEKKYDVTGFYGEGKPNCINTYNHDNVLDQTLQFSLTEIYEKDGFSKRSSNAIAHLCILQVHGGCDVRGGYTTPKVFEVTGYDGVVSMLDYDRGGITCIHGHYWYTDDACHFYGNGDSDEWVEKDTLFGDVTHTVPVKDFSEYTVADFDFELNEGSTYEGTAYCPVCKAKGKKSILVGCEK